jgi:hypothetical protein
MAPRNRLRAVAFSVAGGLLFAACASPFTAATSGDAGPDGGGGLPVEAGSDVDSAVAPPSEAGTDAAPSFESPCKLGTHFLCADFDQKTFEDFTRTRADSTGAVTVTSTLAASAPRAMRSTFDRRASSANDGAARAEKEIAGWKHVRVAFDVQVEPMEWKSGDKPLTLATIVLNSTNEYTGTALFLEATHSSYSVESLPTDKRYDFTPAPFPIGRFFHVDIDFDADKGSLTLVVDGKSTTRSFPPIKPTGTSQGTAITVGATAFDAPTPAFTTTYDNVVIDLP